MMMMIIIMIIILFRNPRNLWNPEYRLRNPESHLTIGHFRVPPWPLFQNEGRCSAFDIEIIFHSHANKTNFHGEGCASRLILKVRVCGTRKWPIGSLESKFHWQRMGIQYLESEIQDSDPESTTVLDPLHGATRFFLYMLEML